MQRPKPKPYTAADGTVTYRVRIRLVGGRQTTETFPNLTQANIFCQHVADMGAEAAVAHRARTDAASDQYVPTVQEMLEQHVRNLTGIDQRTRDDYLGSVSARWRNIVGPYRVDMVDRTLVAHVVNELDGTMKPKTLKNSYSLLSSVMQTAVTEGHLPANPCKGTRLPRAGEEDVDDIRYLTPAEFDLLLGHVGDVAPGYWAFVVTLFGTGLRFSEATALQVRDVNLHDVDGPTVRVTRAWKKGSRIGPPKSKASRRTIALPPEVVEAIRPMLGRTGSAWLFTTERGLPIRHNNFWQRVWRPATVRASICADHLDPKCRCVNPKHAGCPVHTDRDAKGWHILAEPCGCPGTLSPRPRIHDARHTHASWLLSNGARLEMVQDRLGHEDYTTTRRVYAHLQPDMRREAALAAQLAFSSTRLGLPTAGD